MYWKRHETDYFRYDRLIIEYPIAIYSALRLFSEAMIVLSILVRLNLEHVSIFSVCLKL